VKLFRSLAHLRILIVVEGTKGMMCLFDFVEGWKQSLCVVHVCVDWKISWCFEKGDCVLYGVWTVVGCWCVWDSFFGVCL